MNRMTIKTDKYTFVKVDRKYAKRAYECGWLRPDTEMLLLSNAKYRPEILGSMFGTSVDYLDECGDSFDKIENAFRYYNCPNKSDRISYWSVYPNEYLENWSKMTTK